MRWLAVLLLAGCAHAPPSPVGELARTMADEVARLRGLAQRTRVRVEVLEAPAFTRAFHRRSAQKRDAAERQRLRDTWVAFGFAPPELDVARLVDDVLDEQVAGFYDDHDRRLYVRAQSAPLPGDRLSGMTLAHEIEHALQDQHFGLPVLSEIHGDDARLARMAVYEGDATVVMLAYAAQPTALALADALGRATRALDVMGDDGLLRTLGRSPQLQQAPAVMRTLLIFPYLGGMRLLTELFRTGGFALIDRVFRHPPVSTEQVLHPEKYVAGEPPIPVRAPPAPAGTRRVDGGELGELGTRVLLGGALPPDAAQAAAGEWGGDAYTVVENRDGSLGVLWATAWDSDEAAERFEGALRRVAATWKSTAARRAAGAGATVARRGNEVTLCRGVATPAETLLGSSGARLAATPPLGPLTLTPARHDEPVIGSGRIEGDRWIDDHLGLRAELPGGFRALPQPGFALVVRRDAPTRAFGALQWVTTTLSPTDEERLLTLLPRQFSPRVGGVEPREENRGAGRVAFGEGQERSWSFPGHPLRVRAAWLPVCDGRATLLFTQVWEDPSGETALDAWMASVRPMAARLAACP